MKLAGNPLVESIKKALRNGGTSALFEYFLAESYEAVTEAEVEARSNKEEKLKAASTNQLKLVRPVGMSSRDQLARSKQELDFKEDTANINFQIIEDAARPSSVAPVGYYDPLRESAVDYDNEEYDPLADYGTLWLLNLTFSARESNAYDSRIERENSMGESIDQVLAPLPKKENLVIDMRYQSVTSQNAPSPSVKSSQLQTDTASPFSEQDTEN